MIKIAQFLWAKIKKPAKLEHFNCFFCITPYFSVKSILKYLHRVFRNYFFPKHIHLIYFLISRFLILIEPPGWQNFPILY